MERIIAHMQENTPDAADIDRWLTEDFPASAAYREQRAEYIKAGKGTPPSQ
jgi:hypothetical protein